MDAPSAPSVDETPLRSAAWMRWAARVAGIVVVVAVSLAVLSAVRHDGPEAIRLWQNAHIRWWLIALASAFAFAGETVYVIGWQRLLHDGGVEIELPLALRIHLASNLGRYLPGSKVWQMGIVAMMAAETPLPAATLAWSSLMRGIVSGGIATLLLACTAAFGLGLPVAWFCLPAAGAALLVLAPFLLRCTPRLAGVVARRWPFLSAITVRTMSVLAVTSVLDWCAWGVALYLLAWGVLGTAGASYLAYLGAWVGPDMAGLLSVFAPAGIGVRDTAMAHLLQTGGLPAASAVVVAVAARVWDTGIEIIPALIVLAAHGFARRRRLSRGAR